MPKLWMGLEGVGRFDDTPEHRPQNWRAVVLEQDPNGDAPLTAMSAMLPNEFTDDYQFNWFEKEFAAQGGAVTGMYTNPSFVTAYTGNPAAAAYSILYAKVPLETAMLFVPGAAGLLRVGTDFTSDIVCKVEDVFLNGANSRLTLKLLRTDGQGNSNLSAADYILRTGSIHAEGGASPKPISRESEKKYNFTQTFRNSLELTGRMLQTKYRTGDKYKERKGDCLKDHVRDQEWAMMFSEMTDTINADGQHETTMKGIYQFIRDYAPDNILDYRTQTGASMRGKSWVEGGDAFLEMVLERVTAFGPEERLVIGGMGVKAALNELARERGMWQYETKTEVYGIKIRRYETFFGSFDFKTHPLFTRVPSLRNAAFVLYPGYLRRRTFRNRDTHFKKDPKNPFNNGAKEISGFLDFDAIHEEFLTDFGIEVWWPQCHAFISGVGLPNEL